MGITTTTTTTTTTTLLIHHFSVQGYFVYAQPRDAMSNIEDKQRLFVVLAVLAQLLILTVMNYLAYQPYSQLMKALQTRGFVKAGEYRKGLHQPYTVIYDC